MSGLLDGIRVLDLSRLLPGGFATGLLADLGAEVIKVEQPGVGDYMRWMEPKLGDESAASWVIDRGKRSIGVDLKSPRGVEVVRRLVATPPTRSSRASGPASPTGSASATRRSGPSDPRLVYCSISGYGQNGPLRDEAGHDLNYIGRAGLLSITGPHETAGRRFPASRSPTSAAEPCSRWSGVLAALVRAARTGEGEHIDVSMTDGAFALLSVHLGEYFATGVVPGAGADAPERRLSELQRLRLRRREAPHGRGARAEVLRSRVRGRGAAGPRGDGSSTPRRCPPGGTLFLTRTRDEWLEAFAGLEACVGPGQRLRRGERRPAAAPPRDGRRGGAPDARGRCARSLLRSSCASIRPRSEGRRRASARGRATSWWRPATPPPRSRACSPTGSSRREFHRTFGRYRRVWENRAVPDRGDER